MLDLTGCKLGELLVIKKCGRELIPSSGKYRALWKCICACGKTVVRPTSALTRTRGAAKTCGNCGWRIHHSDAYESWRGMKTRCDNIAAIQYPNYGGRGITYCTNWKNFVSFYYDMGDPPYDRLTRERMSIDRIDNDGNYEKSNCKWATKSEQAQNRRARSIMKTV